jgi:hypothetical protein
VPLRKRADIALALGRCDEAIASYVAVAQRRGRSAELERRVARAQAAAGRVPQAIHRLDDALRGCRADQGVTRALELDRARLRGVDPAPPNDARSSPAESRRAARVTAWADPVNEQAVHEALGALVLDGAPAACAAELVEIAALARLGGVHVGGLVAAAGRAAELLGNPSARHLLQTADVDVARCAFLHWEA